MRALWDRLVASDPPLARLRMALRALIALALGGGLNAAIGIPLHFPTSAILLGSMIGMFSTFSTNDPEPAKRRVTAALVPLPAIAAVALASLANAVSPVASNLAFLAILFVAIWARRFGPRGFGLGMVAIFGAFFALFVAIPPPALPAAALMLVVGGLAAWITRFVLIRDDAPSTLRAAAVAFAAQTRLLIAATRTSPPDANALHAQTLELDSAAVTIDTILAGGAFAIDETTRSDARRALLATELAYQRIAERANAPETDDPGVLAPPIAEANAQLARLRETLRDIARAKTTGKADGSVSQQPRPPDIGGLAPTTRQALQATLGCGLAILAGGAIPPHQWFWAVLTAFVVFTGTASAAETRAKTWDRVVGTLIGVGLGFIAVEFTKGRHVLEAVLGVIAFFLAMYTFRLSYALMTFFVTAAVAFIYDLVGRPTDALLLNRLVETIVGAIAGGIAGTLLVPLHTDAVIRALAKTFAEKLDASISASRARLIGEAGDDPIAAVRAADAALHNLAARLRSAHQGDTSTNDAIATIDDAAMRSRAVALQAATPSAPVTREAEEAVTRDLRAIARDATILWQDDRSVFLRQ